MLLPLKYAHVREREGREASKVKRNVIYNLFEINRLTYNFEWVLFKAAQSHKLFMFPHKI